MSVSEPMTMLTDYALGVSSAAWSGLLLRRARRERQRSIALWGDGFAGFAAASIAAGTYHGFARTLEPRTISTLWTCVALAMGLSSCVMLCAAVIAATSGAWRRGLVALAILKLALFLIVAAGSDSYLLLMLDYGSAQLGILALAAYRWRQGRAPSAPWLAAGVAVSAVGAAVQHSGFGLHEHFNHNDLYHVIQMVGLYFLYRGGALFRDRA